MGQKGVEDMFDLDRAARSARSAASPWGRLRERQKRLAEEAAALLQEHGEKILEENRVDLKTPGRRA